MKKNKIPKDEQAIVDMSITDLIKEFDLIHFKKSKLSKRLRDVVVFKVKFLIDKGTVKIEDGFLFCCHPFFNFKKCPMIKNNSCSECEFLSKELKSKSPLRNDKK
jgi:hypothetical protein